MEFIKDLVSAWFGKEDSIWSGILGLLPKQIGNLVSQFIPYVGIVLCVFLLFLGKKILPFVKVSVCFVAGFFASYYWLVPLVIKAVPQLPEIGGYAVAAVIGIIAAILSRFIAILLYVGAAGGFGFILIYNDLLEMSGKLGGITLEKNVLISIASAVIFIVIALLVRKFIAKVATAAIGAYGMIYIVVQSVVGAAKWEEILDMTPVKNHAIVGMALAVLLFFAGLLVQIKTNRKYKI